MDKKIKALHFIYDLSIGGAQTVVMNYLRETESDSSVELKVAVCETSKNSEYDKEVKERNYSVEYLNYKEVKGLPIVKTFINWINYQKLIYKKIKKEKPDIIHSHLSNLLPYILIPALLSGAKVRVHTLHSDPYAIKGAYVPWIKAAFDLFGFYPVCVTEAQAEKAKKRYGFKNCTVIQNGIDLKKFDFPETKDDIRKSLDIAKDAFVIGFVGRLHKVKNIEFLFSVFEEYRKKNQNAVLAIAGDGEERERLLKIAREKGILNYVKFLGMRNDVERIYKMLDVFMLTSFFESSSIVTVEAQLVGVRCVVSDNIPENVVITDNVFRLGLSESLDKWTDAIDGKGVAYPKVNTSEYYSTENTIVKLKQLYRGLYRKQIT